SRVLSRDGDPHVEFVEEGQVLKVKSVRLRDQVPPRITVPPGVNHVEPVEPVTVIQGSLVTLTCEARGVPPPTLTWMKDGQPLSLHRNLLLDGQETRLQLPDVAPSDAGFYSCVASNQAGSSTKIPGDTGSQA
uniref:Ig-like domain-containing protein n=1 Tax=Amphilophus citrinellus TaxID=61819 RepID=A0A3Q0T533_AMPCI